MLLYNVAVQKPALTKLIIAIAGFLALGTCGIVLFMPGDQSQWEMAATNSLSNLKQISNAMVSYTGDNHGRYPPAGLPLTTTLSAYDLKPELFSYKTQTVSSAPILFNERLAGRTRAKIEEPEITICIFGESLVHGRRYPMSFVDGHAKLVHANEAEALRWRPRPRSENGEDEDDDRRGD